MIVSKLIDQSLELHEYSLLLWSIITSSSEIENKKNIATKADI